MNTPVLIALVALVCILCAAGLASILKRRRAQEELVRRVRTSELYGHLYPFLTRCREQCVESVTLRTDGVYIRLYKPAGRALNYTFDKHDMDPMQPQYLYALAQAVAVELPLLQDSTRYTFRTCTEPLTTGQKATYYEYTITTDYKDSMLRADYLSGSRD